MARYVIRGSKYHTKRIYKDLRSHVRYFDGISFMDEIPDKLLFSKREAEKVMKNDGLSRDCWKVVTLEEAQVLDIMEE